MSSYCQTYFKDIPFCMEPEPIATATDLEGAALNAELAIQNSTSKSTMLKYLGKVKKFLEHGKMYQQLVSNTNMVNSIATAITEINGIISSVKNANSSQLKKIAQGPLYAFMGLIGGLFTQLGVPFAEVPVQPVQPMAQPVQPMAQPVQPTVQPAAYAVQTYGQAPTYYQSY